METTLYILLAIQLIGVALAALALRPKKDFDFAALLAKVNELEKTFNRIEGGLKDEFRTNREESATMAQTNRVELTKTIADFRTETTDTLRFINQNNQEALAALNATIEKKVDALIEKTDKKFKEFEVSFEKNVENLNTVQKEKFKLLETKQDELVKNTESKLESIRVTVEEKLEKTLNERLSQSFETVGKQLIEVQKGLGEMQTLAQDVGGLKRVLSNVKMRGGFGEVQLSMLLEQILAPEQYAANVKTKVGEASIVEFAIKLPGKDDAYSQVWLPIDAKFPKDKYEHLQDAYDTGDLTQIQAAQKQLEDTIKLMAKDINQKYLNPPATTDFGIMFLPFEGIYAEVVRKAALLEEIQRNYKVIITGPSTLAAILNSLQMGFRTLAIQKRSSEVWKVLGDVKKEFETFGGLLSKAQNNIQTGLNQLDDVMGTRTKAIVRKLKDVTMLSESESTKIIPEIQEIE